MTRRSPDELGFDGVYWDELSYSAHDIAHGIQDGHSALPDLQTMAVKEQVALTPLYCQDYQVQQTRRVLDAGKLLIGNGQPRTETMTKLHFPRSVEAWQGKEQKSEKRTRGRGQSEQQHTGAATQQLSPIR